MRQAGSGTDGGSIDTSRGLRSRAWRIAVLYAIFAFLWIYFSDLVLSLMVPDPAVIVRWSVYKGIVFVAVTSLLLMWLLRRAFSVTEAGYRQLHLQQEEIERWNRLYAALTQINQSIVMAEDTQGLLERVCSVLVKGGRFQVAWIGWWDPATQRWVLRASSGGDKLIEAVLNTGSGRFPWESPIAAGHEWLSNDLMTDLRVPGWRSLAKRAGLRSSAVFPLRLNGVVMGVMSVFSEEKDFFRDKEIALLQEASMDVSFALNNFTLAEERREAETQARREVLFSQAMIDSMPGILYFYDQTGRFLRWNRNFESVTGCSAQEIATMHPLDFFPEEDKALVESRIGEVFEKGESSVEADFLSRDGTRTPYFFTGKALTYEDRPCLVGVGIDITARKRMEEKLRELNENLEQKVAHRTRELQEAVERAEAADRLKSAFLATMSHELRTPLNSIIGFTGIILQGLAGPLNEEQTRQLEMVRSSARHLLDLINDVLDLSRIEAGQMEVRDEYYDLSASIDQVAATIQPMADRKGLSLNLDVPADCPEVRGDRRRFEQVLINLLNNAVKFSHEGEVSLSVDCVDDGKTLVVTVRDTGIGMKPEELDQIFQPFRQLDSGLTRQHEGTGLGLSICYRLLDLMGGEIRVNSEWGAGTVFTVSLPMEQLEETV